MDAPGFTVSRSVWTCFSFGPHTSLFVAFSTATQMCCEGSREVRGGRRTSGSSSVAFGFERGGPPKPGLKPARRGRARKM
jgi:hypothetical protein